MGWSRCKKIYKEPAKEKVLNKSKRISIEVQEQSNKPIDRISGIRKQKELSSKRYEGECKHISNLGQVDLSKGKWLILTRTKNQLLELMKQVRKKNLYYQSNKGKKLQSKIIQSSKTIYRLDQR